MDANIKHTQVDLGGLMRVLGEALYSTPRVAIRELMQNAYDSWIRRKMEAGEAPQNVISVRCDLRAGTLSVQDHGAGLTDDEIERYLATVGRGYTRRLRDEQPDSELIGYFGLGFLSTFVIAESTEVRTCSYTTPDKTWLFSTRDGQRYSIRPCPSRPIGTEVTLHLKESYRQLSDPAVLLEVLRRYCALLPAEVLFNGEALDAPSPPWRLPEDTSAVRRQRLALKWAALFEPIYEPLCAFEVDEPDLGLRGVVWVQDGVSYASSDSRHVSVFVRGMLISDDERDLLPAWAGFCGAVFESRMLSPTASRESLQDNTALSQAKQRIKQRLVEGLAHISRHNPAAWSRVLTRHNEALLGAALSEPPLFDLVADSVTLPTSEGPLRLPALLKRANNKLHIGTSDKSGFAELLFRALKVPVIDGGRYAAAPFASHYAAVRRGTVVRLGTAQGDEQLFRPATIAPEQIEQIQSWFTGLDAQVLVADFAPAALPFVMVPNEEVLRKRRIEADEAGKRISAGVLHLARLFTAETHDSGAARLYVNGGSPLVIALLDAPAAQRDRVLALLRPLTTLLAQGAFASGDVEGAMNDFSRALQVMLQEPV